MKKRSEVKVPPHPAVVEAKRPIKPLVFDNANRARGESLSPDFEYVVERTFIDDVRATYDQLERDLELGDRRGDRGSLQAALDRSERNARAAHKLWMTAKVEFRKWQLDNEVLHGEMRRNATQTLQQEKEQGLRAKQITDSDVENMCAALYPDEYKAQEVRREKVAAMLKSCENLNDLWFKRSQGLSTLVSKQR